MTPSGLLSGACAKQQLNGKIGVRHRSRISKKEKFNCTSRVSGKWKRRAKLELVADIMSFFVNIIILLTNILQQVTYASSLVARGSVIREKLHFQFDRVKHLRFELDILVINDLHRLERNTSDLAL